MIVKETSLRGAFLIEAEPREDERGSFEQVWTREELEAHGMEGGFVQCNLSRSRRRGTLRGLHYQVGPHAQAKLVRCTAGRIFDVGVDLRADSPTFRRWVGFELSASNRRMLYLPVGFAHGFQTLEDDSEVLYMVTGRYDRDNERGVRWNDPAFGIEWPAADERIINARDAAYTLLDAED
ncbi:MAG TPA: dTDP-4-dehydrorhamnose 3,5-epimerase [Pyrinomonadaceae bacterium]|nr:dTDP-4-dehydrorhamnose 3,5-epimerase [Pyrinomonadaceae bacterium]